MTDTNGTRAVESFRDSPGMAGLKAILRETFGARADGVTPATTAANIPSWDSLQMVNIILAVQSRFGIVLRNRDIDAIDCVGDFASLIDRMIG